MKYDKQLFIFFCLIMIMTNSVQLYLDGDHYLPKLLFGALGVSLLSIPIWILVGGFIIFNFIHAIINLIKPDNNLTFTRLNKASAGLLIGIILKIIFDIRF